MAVQSGKFGEVIKHNAAARDFASSPLHHVEQGLGVIDVGNDDSVARLVTCLEQP